MYHEYSDSLKTYARLRNKVYKQGTKRKLY